MSKRLKQAFFFALISLLLFACAKKTETEKNISIYADSVVPTAWEEDNIAEPMPGDSAYHFKDKEEFLDYLKNSDDSSLFRQGILPVIAAETPDYADKLFSQLSRYDRFLVVDKASMRVILYDRYGREELAYDMACAKNFGTKHKKGDSRTPEGFFSVEGIYDSTDWLFTDDDGNVSQKKGQFGPRFIRLKIPGTSQIGIHGTCSPWSIGHRVSHGCIRVTNENILELVKYVEKGMPAIVLPGKKDRIVNREEGVEILYFPTRPKYAITKAELESPVKTVSDGSLSENSAEAEVLKTDTVNNLPSGEGKESETNISPQDTIK